MPRRHKICVEKNKGAIKKQQDQTDYIISFFEAIVLSLFIAVINHYVCPHGLITDQAYYI